MVVKISESEFHSAENLLYTLVYGKRLIAKSRILTTKS